MLISYSVSPVRPGKEKKPVKSSKEALVEVAETFKLWGMESIETHYLGKLLDFHLWRVVSR